MGAHSVIAENEITSITESSDSVEILSHSYYLSMGYSTVVGEVHNIDNNILDFVKLTVTFYDADDKVISTAFTFTQLSTLNPQEKAPFEISSFPDDNLQVDHYRLSVSGHSSTSTYPYRELTIKGVTAGTEIGYYTVRGEVENTGNIDSTFVSVIATYYDSDGTVIGTSFTFADPMDISSGRTAPFEISSFPLEISPASYSLAVQCSESAPAPEPSPSPEAKQGIPGFPIESILIGLLMGVFGLLLKNRNI